MKSKDQDRVQDDIEYCAGSHADHGVECISLKPDLVVEDELGGHIGGSYEDDPKVILCIGQDSLGRAEDARQGR